MSYDDLNSLFFVCKYTVWAIWGILFLLLCWNLIRKNYHQLKINILYCINTVVFIVAYYYILSLAIIVQFSGGGDAREESIRLLKSRAYDFFFDQLLISLAFVAGAAIFNVVYMRVLLKHVERKIILRVAIIELIILLLCSAFACTYYFVGLRSGIDDGYDYLEKNAKMNNVKLLPDSTLRIEIEETDSINKTTTKPIGHLRDTTFVAGNAVIFLRPDSLRFEEMSNQKVPGLFEVDADFGFSIRQSLDIMEGDSAKFSGIAAEIVTTRYIVLTGCKDCPTTIDRDTVNYGIILTGTGRAPKLEYNSIHSRGYNWDIKDYFELWN